MVDRCSDYLPAMLVVPMTIIMTLMALLGAACKSTTSAVKVYNVPAPSLAMRDAYPYVVRLTSGSSEFVATGSIYKGPRGYLILTAQHVVDSLTKGLSVPLPLSLFSGRINLLSTFETVDYRASKSDLISGPADKAQAAVDVGWILLNDQTLFRTDIETGSVQLAAEGVAAKDMITYVGYGRNSDGGLGAKRFGSTSSMVLDGQERLIVTGIGGYIADRNIISRCYDRLCFILDIDKNRSPQVGAGDSGGPVLNDKGFQVGIITQGIPVGDPSSPEFTLISHSANLHTKATGSIIAEGVALVGGTFVPAGYDQNGVPRPSGSKSAPIRDARPHTAGLYPEGAIVDAETGQVVQTKEVDLDARSNAATEASADQSTQDRSTDADAARKPSGRARGESLPARR